MKKCIFALFVMFSFPLHAKGIDFVESNVLNIDRAINNPQDLAFPNDQHLNPKSSDFKLINYITMSTGRGERWAVLTIKNTSTGTRIFESRNVLALFADGERKSPKDYKFTLNFKPEETQTFTLSFGQNKFPILSINTYPLLN